MTISGSSSPRAIHTKAMSFGAAALGMLAMTAQAEAADMFAPPPPPAAFPVAVPAPLWSGLYAGAHIGGAWADVTTSDLNNYWGESYGVPHSVATFYGTQHTDQNPSGLFGGGTIGYNMQRNGVVFGIEADFGYLDLNQNTTLNTPSGFGIDQSAYSHVSTGFYGDLTGRLGWAWGPWLLYGKGGLAILESTTNVRDPLSSYGPSTNDDSRVGWTAGGGFEYLWNQAWSMKVEYQYFDFGTASSTLNFGGATYNFNHDLDVSTVKLGINYHLGCCDSTPPIVPFK